MISLRYFVLILFILCGRELAGPSPAVDPGKSLLALLGVTLGFALLTKIVAYRAVRRSRPASAHGLLLARETFETQRLFIERCWCVLLPLMLLGTGWFSWTHYLQEQGWPQTLVLLTCFVPAISFLVLVEMTAAQLDHLCHVGGCQQPQSSATAGRYAPQVESAVSNQWRQGWQLRLRLGDLCGLFTCLFPVLVLALVSDLSAWAETALGTDSGWVKIPAAFAVLSGFVAMFPLLLTRWSDGQRLPAPLEFRINTMAAQLSIRGVRPVLIPSQGRWAGAAIVGWLPGLRNLWLGDAIVSELSPRQLDMVILHELAHVRRMHFLWRMIPVWIALVLGLAAWTAGGHLGWDHWILFKFTVAASVVGTLLLGMGRTARRCELDADRVACELALKTAEWSSWHCPAHELAGALSHLLADTPSQASTWLHPSLSKRLESLMAWKSDKSLSTKGLPIGTASRASV